MTRRVRIGAWSLTGTANGFGIVHGRLWALFTGMAMFSINHYYNVSRERSIWARKINSLNIPRDFSSVSALHGPRAVQASLDVRLLRNLLSSTRCRHATRCGPQCAGCTAVWSSWSVIPERRGAFC